jgi:hypothetical protein
MRRVEVGLMNLGMLLRYKQRGLLRTTFRNYYGEVSPAQLNYHLDRVMNKIELASRRAK